MMRYSWSIPLSEPVCQLFNEIVIYFVVKNSCKPEALETNHQLPISVSRIPFKVEHKREACSFYSLIDLAMKMTSVKTCRIVEN